MLETARFHNEDCVEGCKRHIPDGSVDLIVTDPPYGIQGDTLHKHYNRKEKFVLDGYIEVPAEEYGEFSRQWVRQAERILRPGGSVYIVSGYTNLVHILNALRQTTLKEVNHLVWKYNFGVYTTRKYVSSHYHILYCVKPGARPTFNTYCRYGADEKDGDNGSRNYQDREDVWTINREYKPGQAKNKNELPTELLAKLIQYSSNEGDLVCDLFLGGFSTAKVAIQLGRRACGFEKSKTAFAHHLAETAKIAPGSLLPALRKPEGNPFANQRQPWSESEKQRLWRRYGVLLAQEGAKNKAIEALCAEFGRGRWAVMRIINEMPSSGAPRPETDAFVSAPE